MRIIFVTKPLYWKAHIKHGGHVCICKNDSFVGQFESMFAPVMATFGWSYKSNASLNINTWLIVRVTETL